MTHTYNITGMTCNGCVTSVKNALLKINGVTSADVQLNAPQATITLSQNIPVAQLQNGINSKYTITAADSAMMSADMSTVTADKPSYYPIFLIFGFIAGITLLIQFSKGTFNTTQWMEHFMAGFFLLFSFFKLLNLNAFADGYGTYDIIAKKWRTYGYIYPFIELLLGIAYLTDFRPLAINIITLAVMGISSIGVAQSLLKKITFQCACLGTIVKLPLSKVTLFEDLLMVAMSLAMVLMLTGVF